MKFQNLDDVDQLRVEMLDASVHERPIISADSLHRLPARIPEPPPGDGTLASEELVKTKDGANWVIFVLAGSTDASAAQLNNLGCAYGRIDDWKTAEATFKRALEVATDEDKPKIQQNLNVAQAAVAADV
jgi:hypothetical protein